MDTSGPMGLGLGPRAKILESMKTSLGPKPSGFWDPDPEPKPEKWFKLSEYRLKCLKNIVF